MTLGEKKKLKAHFTSVERTKRILVWEIRTYKGVHETTWRASSLNQFHA